ncbi:MAG: ATP-binding protein [Bacteroidales bacterium]|jgi:signal transduction histidine kinase
MTKIIKTMKGQFVFAIILAMMISSVLPSFIYTVLYYFGIFNGEVMITLFIFIFVPFVGVTISTMVAIIVSRTITKPVNALVRGLKEVADGNYAYRVDNKGVTNDELRILLDNFNLMAAELESTKIFKKDFINNFSHEFKTPIVSIRGFAKQLKKETISAEQKIEFADIIISESERLSNLASNILLLNKYENETIITDKSYFSIAEQIRICILMLQKQWEEKQISFNLELEEIDYYSNKDMFMIIWVNLLTNSIKFSPEDSEIDIKGYQKDRVYYVEIKDRGIGMTEATMRHIFEQFYQGNTSHKTNGNGLGLAIVKRIVDLCQGQIQVDSFPDKGTAFIISLPLNK